jgi:Stigma-specific protein, Stig1
VACHQAGGTCGDGINSCCAGWRCGSGGTCATCAWGGQSCTTTGDCCSGTCTNGSCVGGLGGTCVSQAGCSQGECREGRCQCAVDQILCNSGCTSYTDPNNCRGCGNVCPTGTGRVCTVNGCVCDPQSALPDECNGVCVNKSNDRTNCGLCFNTCPKLEQVCNSGVCGCPAGQTDCNGSCVDTRTNQSHCGMCNRGCPPSTEVCSAGNCACAAGLTRCPAGNCVNLLTDKYNCNACGTTCPGNKTCNSGSCG